MADHEVSQEIDADTDTDKAYAKAVEAIAVKADPVVTKPEAPAPVKVKAAPRIKAAPEVKAEPKTKPVMEMKAAPKPVAKPAPKPARKVSAPKATAPKAAAPKAARKMAPKAARKAAKTVTTTPFAGLFTNFTLEDTMMDMSPNFAGFQNVVTEAQAKAKEAFEKSTSVLGDVSDFTKGNVEAVMESGKILAEGLQGIGSELVTEGRTAFEVISADIKELAAAKSPTDFFKVQGDMMRKSIDSAVAYGSKNSEVMLKLMTDAIAPISGRVSIAMEKARTTAL